MDTDAKELLRKGGKRVNEIDIRNLTRDYGNGKGVFDICLTVGRGEAFGYLGPNGAGKTTTMRHLMGFIRPRYGSARVQGMDCWKNRSRIQKKIGYLPGEICFPGDMTGISYLKLIAAMRKMKDFSAAEKLIDYFELDPKGKIRSMSKGMKQKTALVAAFMHDPEILLLDEPSSGLDPLMQGKLIELIENEKKRGKTILLSSHIFEEVEKTCDRIGMIKSGRIIRQITADELRVSQMKTYVVIMADDEGCAEILRMYPDAVRGKEQRELKVSVTDGCINELLALLSAHRVLSLTEEKHTLEEYFMKFYGGDEK